jgi:hypothetical protein
VIKFVSGFLWVLWFPPPIKLTEILLKVVLNTINQIKPTFNMQIFSITYCNKTATLAAQGMPVSSQGLFLPKFFPGISPSYPMISIPSPTNNGIYGVSIPLSQQAATNLTTSKTITVQIPTPNERNDQPVIKQEPSSPVENLNSNSNHSSITSHADILHHIL